MSEDLHPMDDLFRTGLNDREESPTPAVWDAIEKELDKKDRKPAGGFFRLSGRAAVIALVLLGSAGLFAAGYYLRGIQLAKEQKNPSPATETPARNYLKEETPQSLQAPEVTQNERPAHQETAGSDHQEQDQRSAIPTLPSAGTGEADNKPMQKPSSIASSTSDSQEGENLVKENKKNSGKQISPRMSAVPDQETTVQKFPDNTGDNSLTPVWATEPKEPAMVESPVASHALVIPALKIPVSSKQPSSPGFVQNASIPEKNNKQIPVANKKAAGLVVPKFSLTPYAAYQSHSVKLDDDGSSWGYHLREDMERTEQLPSKISGGILADLRIGKQFSLQSGLGLMQLNVNIQPKQIRAEKDIDGKVKYRLDCSAGTYFINPKQGNYPIPGDTISTQMATNSLKYLTIPLAVKYHFGSEKLQFFATAGTGINLLTSQNLNAMVKHQYQYYGGRTTNLKSSYFNGMIGAGATYFINKRLGIYVSPQYNFALTSMNEGLPVKSLPRTFNLQTGVTIKL